MNTATLVILLAPWGLWMLWELVILYQRRPDSPTKPATISMVAMRHRWHLTSMAYTWGGMGTHWLWPAPAFAPVWMGVAFWVVALGLLISDVALWKSNPATWPRWVKLVRLPLLWLALGALAGRLLFPQVAGDGST